MLDGLPNLHSIRRIKETLNAKTGAGRVGRAYSPTLRRSAPGANFMKTLAPEQLVALKYPNFRLRFAASQNLNRKLGYFSTTSRSGVFLLRRKCLHKIGPRLIDVPIICFRKNYSLLHICILFLLTREADSLTFSTLPQTSSISHHHLGKKNLTTGSKIKSFGLYMKSWMQLIRIQLNPVSYTQSSPRIKSTNLTTVHFVVVCIFKHNILILVNSLYLVTAEETMIQIIALFLLVSAELSVSTNPGIKARVSKKGIDYGKMNSHFLLSYSVYFLSYRFFILFCFYA